jgi:NADPH:quinone reductase-like Zn-dependent oxidoreductase
VKAAAFGVYGSAEVLEYAEVPDPVPGPADVVVRVAACGVNHSDLDSRAGTSRWPFKLPMVLGAEFAGTVVAAGRQVSSVSAGEEVTALMQYSCGQCQQCANWRQDLCGQLEIFGTTRWGGYAEYVTVPERAVVLLQPGDNLAAVAAGQCVVSTAWHMATRLAVVRPGDLVLVPSASGGVGGALVQCAVLAGATVVATVSSAAKAEHVRGLGAARVLIAEPDLPAALRETSAGRGFDVVLDAVGGPLFGTHLAALRDDGTLVTCGAHAGEVVALDLIPLFRRGWRIVGFRIALPADLHQALAMIRGGQVKVPVAAALALPDAAKAHRLLEEREIAGKVVLLNTSD